MGRIQRVGNKLVKANLVMENSMLTNYHPKTKALSKDNLKRMMDEYKMVFIKPIYGMHGNGVMRLDRKKEGYQIQSGASKKMVSSFSSFYQKIREKTKKKAYMAQKGIHLLKYQDAPFDIRVMIQKNEKNHWECSGMLCRVAHPRKVVTNLVHGGRVMSVDQLLRLYLSNKRRSELKEKLKRISLETAYHFTKKYPGLKELGLDIAIDQQGKPWILEVNTMPNLWLFCRLSDKKMFRRIIQNAKVYGRV